MADLAYCDLCGDAEAATIEAGRCKKCRTLIVARSEGQKRRPGLSAPKSASVPEAPARAGRAERRDPIVSLTFPWATVQVDGSLNIGRLPDFSPIAAELETFGLISRMHCCVQIEHGAVWLEHKGQTHPTYINGQALVVGSRTTLLHGDVINLAGQVEVRVTVLKQVASS